MTDDFLDKCGGSFIGGPDLDAWIDRLWAANDVVEAAREFHKSMVKVFDLDGVDALELSWTDETWSNSPMVIALEHLDALLEEGRQHDTVD